MALTSNNNPVIFARHKQSEHHSVWSTAAVRVAAVRPGSRKRWKGGLLRSRFWSGNLRGGAQGQAHLANFWSCENTRGKRKKFLLCVAWVNRRKIVSDISKHATKDKIVSVWKSHPVGQVLTWPENLKLNLWSLCRVNLLIGVLGPLSSLLFPTLPT